MPRTPAAQLTPALVIATLFTAFVAGCGSSNTSWKKGQKPMVSTVAQTGTYELVSGKEVLATYQVFAGEPLGFRVMDNGRVEAVAGMYTVDLLNSKSYAWRMANGK